jgi:hypothetical protein
LQTLFLPSAVGDQDFLNIYFETSHVFMIHFEKKVRGWHRAINLYDKKTSRGAHNYLVFELLTWDFIFPIRLLLTARCYI